MRAYSNAAAAALDRAELARCVKAREIFLSMPFNCSDWRKGCAIQVCAAKENGFFHTSLFEPACGKRKESQAFLDELSALNYLIAAQCGAERDFIIPVGGGENK